MKWDRKQTNVDVKACVFEQGQCVTLAGENDNFDFEIVGYSGDIIPNHWWWGNLAFDLDGIRFTGKKTPVLDSHDTAARLGVATSRSIDRDVRFKGTFLKNERASSMRSDIDQGFPMQASLRLVPGVIEDVKAGESVKVNGLTLTGPGAVFRKSTVDEVSMCTFGADRKTSCKVFDDDEVISFSLVEREDMATKKTPAEKTPEKAAEREPTEAAAEDLIKRFNQFCEAFDGEPGFIVEQFKAGATFQDASIAFAKLMRDQRDEARKAPEVTVTLTETVTDLAAVEFSDSPEKQKPKTFEQTEEGWKEEYAATASLQEEFSSAESYASFMKNNQAGRVRILSA